MPRHSAVALAVLAACVACAGGRRAENGEARGVTDPGTGATSASPATPSGGAGSDPSTLRLTADDNPRGVVPRLENHGRRAVSVRTELTLERERAGTFEAVADVTGLALLDRCDGPGPATGGPCRELAPGAGLLPPPWTGHLGRAQCGCPGCADAPDGRYRFVAQTCDGRRVLGEPFRVPL